MYLLLVSTMHESAESSHQSPLDVAQALVDLEIIRLSGMGGVCDMVRGLGDGETVSIFGPDFLVSQVTRNDSSVTFF